MSGKKSLEQALTNSNFGQWSKNGEKFSLYECPICGKRPTNITKAASAFLKIDDAIVFNCFYCEAGAFESNTILAIKALGLNPKEYDLKFRDLFHYDYKQKPNILQTKPFNYKELEEFDEAQNNPVIMEYLTSRKLERFHKKLLSYKGNLYYPVFYDDDTILGGRVRILPQENEKIIYTHNPNTQNNPFLVFNANIINTNKTIYVFEGVEDALSCGFRNVVASFGLNIDVIANYFSGCDVVFCYDNDEKGNYVMDNVVNLNYFNTVGRIIYDESFGDFKDMNDRIKNGYSFKDNANYIKSHIIYH